MEAEREIYNAEPGVRSSNYQAAFGSGLNARPRCSFDLSIPVRALSWSI
jgi:hypothetical protein